MATRNMAGRGAFVNDPLTGRVAELRRIQPYQATKPYRCPGCNQEIAVGTGHVVVVPLDDPGERRHWHQACWAKRATRPPGR
jgi:hypothetical protein